MALVIDLLNYPKSNGVFIDINIFEGAEVWDSCPACGGGGTKKLLELNKCGSVTVDCCVECCHVFYGSHPYSQAIEDYYRSKWGVDAGRESSAHVVKNRARPWLDSLCAQLQTRIDSRILDFGCGYGGVIMYLVDLGYTNVSGFELSESRASVAKNVVNGQWLESLNPEDKYDLILCSHVLEHTTDPLQVLRNLASECLDSNGFLVIKVPNNEFEPPFHQIFNLSHLHSFGWESLKRLIERAGLACRPMQEDWLRSDEIGFVCADSEALLAGLPELRESDGQVTKLEEFVDFSVGSSVGYYHLPAAPYPTTPSRLNWLEYVLVRSLNKITKKRGIGSLVLKIWNVFTGLLPVRYRWKGFGSFKVVNDSECEQNRMTQPLITIAGKQSMLVK